MKAFLILHRGALGDFVLTWPVLAALRRKYPHHRLVGVGRPDYLELAKALGLLDAGFDCEGAAWLPFHAGGALPEVLSPDQMDGALLWTGENSKLLSLLTRTCSEPVVFHPPFPSEETNGDAPGETHVLDHHLVCLSRFSLPTVLEGEPFFTLNLSPKNISQSVSQSVPQPLQKKEKGYFALIHPGSGSSTKNYTSEFYAKVAGVLQKKGYPDTRIVLGPVEQGLRRHYENRFRIEEPSSALELARLLSRASLFVGNDSGVSHLAASLGIPTLALYKSTSPAKWGVRGRAARSLTAKDETEAQLRLGEVLANGKFTHPEFRSELLSQASLESAG